MTSNMTRQVTVSCQTVAGFLLVWSCHLHLNMPPLLCFHILSFFTQMTTKGMTDTLEDAQAVKVTPTHSIGDRVSITHDRKFLVCTRHDYFHFQDS